MTSKQLGNSILHVSSLGFGAWPIGGTTYGNISRDDGRAALERYFELGGRLIDTARGYRTSESIIGEVLASDNLRPEIVIASKTKANTPKVMRFDLETSLRELGTDYLDIYYLHQPPADPAERDIALAAMLQFKAEAKIRMIGASINGPNVTADTEQMCRDYIPTGQIGVIQLIFTSSANACARSCSSPGKWRGNRGPHRFGKRIPDRKISPRNFLPSRRPPQSLALGTARPGPRIRRAGA